MTVTFAAGGIANLAFGSINATVITVTTLVPKVPARISGAKGVDPGIITNAGPISSYSASLTNVTLAVDPDVVGATAVVEAAVYDSQGDDAVWGLSISATGPTTNVNNLLVSFDYDTNRLTLIDTNDPTATYKALADGVENSVRSQFSATSSNTLVANLLTVFSGATYHVLGDNTTIWDETAALAMSPPELTILPSTTNSWLVCWPSASTGFVLQESPDLGTTSWTNVSQTPTDDGVSKCVTVDATNGSMFYRLQR